MLIMNRVFNNVHFLVIVYLVLVYSCISYLKNNSVTRSHVKLTFYAVIDKGRLNNNLLNMY